MLSKYSFQLPGILKYKNEKNVCFLQVNLHLFIASREIGVFKAYWVINLYGG